MPIFVLAILVTILSSTLAIRRTLEKGVKNTIGEKITLKVQERPKFSYFFWYLPNRSKATFFKNVSIWKDPPELRRKAQRMTRTLKGVVCNWIKLLCTPAGSSFYESFQSLAYTLNTNSNVSKLRSCFFRPVYKLSPITKQS